MKSPRSGSPLVALLAILILSSIWIPGIAGAKSPEQDPNQNSSSRREPPPFDRPPLNQSSSQGKQTQPVDYPEPGTYSRGDSPATDPGRGRSDRPTLRRNDSGNNSQASQAPQTRPAGQTNRQDASRPSQNGGVGEETIKLDASLVNIPILVSDRSGRYVPRLRKEDFDLYEDGVRQQVAFFGNDEVPFSVALMLDNSPSVGSSLQDIQDAALAFVRQLRANDRVMIVSFDERTRFLTDFTSDRGVLERAILSTRTGNGTSVYEAVYDTVNRKLKNIEGRKALILLSDGEDTTSRRVKYDEAINTVTESGVLVYGLRFPDSGGYGGGGHRSRSQWPLPGGGSSYPRMPFPFPFPGGRRGPFLVPDSPDNGGATQNQRDTRSPDDPFLRLDRLLRDWLGDDDLAALMLDPGTSGGGQWGRNRDRGRDFMADVAEAGGGPVYDAHTVTDMSRLAKQIADELRNVYVISYYPTNALSNGGYRALRVSVKGRDDLAVRHRRGYDAAEMRGRDPV